MKILTFLSATLFLLASTTSFARIIDEPTAARVAVNFYYETYNRFEGPVAYEAIRISGVHTETVDGQPVFYIFHMGPVGFVMVSAEDALRPVLGYSFDHPFGLQNQPANVKYWMQHYADQVIFAREMDLEPDLETTAYWQHFLTEDITSLDLSRISRQVEPLLTSLWNQGWPYNYYCPPCSGGGSGGHTWAGCVATAIAQMGYYYRWPDHGQGHSSYIPTTHPEYGVQSADYENTWYRYNEMVDSSITVNLAIAEYIYHLAVAIQMDFDPDGSAPNADDSLYYYFKTFPYTWLYRDSMPDEEWKAILVEKLDRACPVYYSGDVMAGAGHAFVCDGYQDADLFHFNLGWGGTSNGYYTIDNILGFNYHQMISSVTYPDTLQFLYPLYASGADTLRGLEGSLTDGSGPLHDYLNNAQVSWLISPQSEMDSVTSITLSFARFETFDQNDKVMVYDGNTPDAPLLAELYGNGLPDDITSTGNEVFVEFITDDANTAAGWLINYTCEQPEFCHGWQVLSEMSGQISDGSGEFYYYNDMLCMWKIMPTGNTDPITLVFTEFSTEEGADFVKVYDLANNDELASYSGQYTPPPDPVTSPSGKMMVVFSTGTAGRDQGFSAWYGITGVEEEHMENMVLVYPNPAGESMWVEVQRAESKDQRSEMNYEISVFDLLGQPVKIINDEQTEARHYRIAIDISALSPGIYIIRIQLGQAMLVKKLIKH